MKDAVNLERMEVCAKLFTGRHDFWSFTERPGEQGSTIVVVEEIRLQPQGDLILIRLSASHFLWKMVRRIVGVLVQTGKGRLEMNQVKDFLKKPSKDVGQWTAPASGLFLEKVIYPGEATPKTISAAVPVISF